MILFAQKIGFMKYDNLNGTSITEKIEIYNCDCMELLKQTPDNFYQLSIVDPPYEVDMSGGKAKKNGFKSRQHWDKMNNWDKRPTKEYFEQLFRVSKNQIIWGANYFVSNLPPSMGWIFWYKMQDNFSFSTVQLHSTAIVYSLTPLQISMD